MFIFFFFPNSKICFWLGQLFFYFISPTFCIYSILILLFVNSNLIIIFSLDSQYFLVGMMVGYFFPFFYFPTILNIQIYSGREWEKIFKPYQFLSINQVLYFLIGLGLGQIGMIPKLGWILFHYVYKNVKCHFQLKIIQCFNQILIKRLSNYLFSIKIRNDKVSNRLKMGTDILDLIRIISLK